MYAIVEVGGKQIKAEENKFFYTNRLDAETGSKVEFGNVLLIDDNGKVKVGAPTVSGAKVTGKVMGHMRDDKVMIFKKKRRKGYRKSQGHRQDLTQVMVEKINK